VQIFLSAPAQLATKRRKVEKEKKTLVQQVERVSPGIWPRLPGHLQPRQVERYQGELTPPPPPPLSSSFPLLDSLRLQQQILRIDSSLEVVSMTADIGQHR